jgi:hypothetical protein
MSQITEAAVDPGASDLHIKAGDEAKEIPAEADAGLAGNASTVTLDFIER